MKRLIATAIFIFHAAPQVAHCATENYFRGVDETYIGQPVECIKAVANYNFVVSIIDNVIMPSSTEDVRNALRSVEIGCVVRLDEMKAAIGPGMKLHPFVVDETTLTELSPIMCVTNTDVNKKCIAEFDNKNIAAVCHQLQGGYYLCRGD